MVIGLLLHSLRPPSLCYLILYSISLQLYLPRLCIAVSPHHQRCSIFRSLWLWAVRCLLCFYVLQTTPCTILEHFLILLCLLVRTFFSFFYFLLMTPWTLWSPCLSKFLVHLPVYLPLLSLLIMLGVHGSSSHLADVLVSLLCSFVVEVWFGDLLAFV